MFEHLKTRQQFRDEAVTILASADGMPVALGRARIATAQVLATLAISAPESAPAA